MYDKNNFFKSIKKEAKQAHVNSLIAIVISAAALAIVIILLFR